MGPACCGAVPPLGAQQCSCVPTPPGRGRACMASRPRWPSAPRRPGTRVGGGVFFSHLPPTFLLQTCPQAPSLGGSGAGGCTLAAHFRRELAESVTVPWGGWAFRIPPNPLWECASGRGSKVRTPALRGFPCTPVFRPHPRFPAARWQTLLNPSGSPAGQAYCARARQRQGGG